MLTLLFITSGCGVTEQSGAADGSNRPEPITLTVSAASSLADTLTEINYLYIHLDENIRIETNFAASGDLVNQIKQGAPADIFISAAPGQMNELQDNGYILSETRRDLLGNEIVLIVPVDSPLAITEFEDLIKADVIRIAIGDPDFVPAGSYARQALELCGIYEELKTKFIFGSNVRQVLNYVESGNVDAGFLFATDVLSPDRVRIAVSAPAEINDSIVYPVAVIASSANIEAAKNYLDFLFSTEAEEIFEKAGFVFIGN